MTAAAVIEDATGASAPGASARMSAHLAAHLLPVTSDALRAALAAPSGSGHPNPKVN